MKKLLKVLLTSCAAEKWFNIGIKVPSGFSGYAARSYAQVNAETPYDVIIVPGIPYDPNSPSSIMRIRVLWAKYLYDNSFTKNIIFSGSAVYSPYMEGAAMKLIADSLGIPRDHTFYESTAEHSAENVYYSWRMAKTLGFQKIALATDPFQSYMLRGFVKKYCPEVEAVPVVFDKIKGDGTILPEIDINHVFVIDFVPLPHRETIRQRFAGTRGKRVKAEAVEINSWNTFTLSGPDLAKN